jgi:hypothetical protein
VGRKGCIPVGRSTKRNTIWTVGQRPNLSDNNPGARAPGVTEVNNEQPNHDHGSPSSTLVVWPVIGEAGNNGSDDEMAGGHTDSTSNEDGLATPTVDIHDGRNYTMSAYELSA